jgi:hypothetical glycosyl hydrolase
MLCYESGTGENENWILAETSFDANFPGKCETIMALGNGYVGLRATTEESYLKQTRNTFVAGTFNKFDDNESSELPNAADTLEMEIILNGESFSLESGTIQSYQRSLNLKTGELVRNIQWESPKGEGYQLRFRRFVSIINLHYWGMKVEITPLTSDATIQITSGINGQMTNSGTQHFHEGEKRIFDKDFLQLIQTTTETKIDFVINATHRAWVGEEERTLTPRMSIGRRKVDLTNTFQLKQNTTLKLEKFNSIHTSRDRNLDAESYKLEDLRQKSLSEMKTESQKGYDQLFQESVEKWREYWNKVDIQIESVNEFDQLAVRFAQYHMLIMTPAHDPRFGIGAKGLTGEGYKGHSFWDSEIFILPYFLYTNPEIARTLLEFRHDKLAGAREKALINGYEGAMYPWESAFSGKEETPEWAAVNILTGAATKVWSGVIEQHITADIAFAIWNYYSVTNDKPFMDQYGNEILFEAATFWASRVKWIEEKQRFEVLDVVGPDEYKEYIDNNAFTNYMAHWTMTTAAMHYQDCLVQPSKNFNRLVKTLNLDTKFSKWKQAADKLYLPQPRKEDHLIPQDDTYLAKPVIDISKYKETSAVQTILHDYSREQVNELQVSKQADIVMLFYLLGEKFSNKVKKANFNYYESKTLHDSSLSMAVHSIVASELGDTGIAYQCFKKALEIDLGPNMSSSDAGIHAASLGGIWKAVVFGFAGIGTNQSILQVKPVLPNEWTKVIVPIHWRGDKLLVEIGKERIFLQNLTKHNQNIQLKVLGEEYTLTNTIEINRTLIEK